MDKQEYKPGEKVVLVLNTGHEVGAVITRCDSFGTMFNPDTPLGQGVKVERIKKLV